MTIATEHITIGALKFKPFMTLREQFKIPAPFKTWCHCCNTGFMSIDEMTAHNNQWRTKHQGVK